MKANEHFWNSSFRLTRSIGYCVCVCAREGECIIFVGYECEKWRERCVLCVCVCDGVLSNFHSLERAISMKHIDAHAHLFENNSYCLLLCLLRLHHFMAPYFLFFSFFSQFVSELFFVMLNIPYVQAYVSLSLSRLLSSFHNWLTFTRVHSVHTHIHICFENIYSLIVIFDHSKNAWFRRILLNFINYNSLSTLTMYTHFYNGYERVCVLCYTIHLLSFAYSIKVNDVECRRSSLSAAVC